MLETADFIKALIVGILPVLFAFLLWVPYNSKIRKRETSFKRLKNMRFSWELIEYLVFLVLVSQIIKMCLYYLQYGAFA